ncbi:hypothetical protein SOVF_209400, partial [Spinacia oleracea]
ATVLFLAKPDCITWNTNLDENQLFWKVYCCINSTGTTWNLCRRLW